jgi:hypothetical protein
MYWFADVASKLPAAGHSLRHRARLVVARLIIGGAQRQHGILQPTCIKSKRLRLTSIAYTVSSTELDGVKV